VFVSFNAFLQLCLTMSHSLEVSFGFVNGAVGCRRVFVFADGFSTTQGKLMRLFRSFDIRLSHCSTLRMP
jgi:hypothetical protein